MKKTFLLFLALTCAAVAQPTMPVGFWKTQASSAWYPLAIGDSLKFLFDPDSIPKANGDTLYHWRNLARTDIRSQPFQSTSSYKPTFRDSSGVRWVFFDGVNDFLTTGIDAGIAAPYTVYTVFRVVSPGNFPTLDDNRAGESGSVVSSYREGTTLYVGSGPFANTGLVYQSDSVRIVEMTVNGASSSYRAASKSFVLSAATNLGTGKLVGRTLGAVRLSPPQYQGGGNLYFHAVISGATEAQRNAMWNYLRTRFGI